MAVGNIFVFEADNADFKVSFSSSVVVVWLLQSVLQAGLGVWVQLCEISGDAMIVDIAIDVSTFRRRDARVFSSIQQTQHARLKDSWSKVVDNTHCCYQRHSAKSHPELTVSIIVDR